MAHRALAESIDSFETGLDECHRAEDRELVERYLAALAPVLAGTVLGNDVLGRIHAVERLLGNSWLIDEAPFEPALAKWREFKDEYQRFVCRGMTVNEWLCAFALDDDYDRAVASGDVDAARAILEAIHVDPPSIRKILGKIRGDAPNR